jgi:hypothetical protein
MEDHWLQWTGAAQRECGKLESRAVATHAHEPYLALLHDDS